MNWSRYSGLSRQFLRAGRIAVVLLASDWAVNEQASAALMADPVTPEIQRRLSEAGEVVRIDGEMLDAAALRRFYEPRGWRPAWIDTADRLIAILAAADQEGLPLAPFHLPALSSRRAAAAGNKVAEGDLLLTDALLRYAAAMRGQRIDPTEIEDDWFLTTPPFDAVDFLKDHSKDLLMALPSLSAPYAAYQLLRAKLAELKAIAAAGDWPKVPPGAPLKPGAEDDRIPALRRRLIASGELEAADASNPLLYDDALLAAVKLFQQRHGLDDDGVVGGRSLAALNVSAAERARGVALNMERWRWLPQRLEEDHIVVNVPAAWMEVVEHGTAQMAMRVVVGDPDHPTPALHAKMTSLVLNPIWRIPASIATNEILPKLKKNPGYLIANELELISDSFPPGSPESQGIGISWHQMTSMPWAVRQRAGAENALGRIKFNIPNNDDIYLHDTPNHKAFARAYRALSHGCVRLEKPDDLALYLLRDKDWSPEKLADEIGKGETHSVSLNRNLPVWLLYWTNWVDANGVLQIRDDIYGRDQDLAAALAHANRSPQIVLRSAIKVTPVANCEGCRLP